MAPAATRYSRSRRPLRRHRSSSSPYGAAIRQATPAATAGRYVTGSRVLCGLSRNASFRPAAVTSFVEADRTSQIAHNAAAASRHHSIRTPPDSAEHARLVVNNAYSRNQTRCTLTLSSARSLRSSTVPVVDRQVHPVEHLGAHTGGRPNRRTQRRPKPSLSCLRVPLAGVRGSAVRRRRR